MTEILNAANEYLSRKFSIIPVAKSKKPIIPWEKYQKELPSKENINAWWGNSTQNNIAIVTGVISNLAVIDIDDIEAAKPVLDTLIPEFLDIPAVQTPSGGQHLYFRCPDDKIGNNAKAVPGCDFRANGGYVIVPPSENYTWINPIQDDIPNLPQAYINYVKTHSSKKEKHLVNTDISYFEHGRRDDDLFTVANVLTKAGHNHEFIVETLRRIVLSWGETDEVWVQAKVESALKREGQKHVSLSEEIQEWINHSSGMFLSTDIYRDLNIVDRKAKKNCSEILRRLVDKSVIERIGIKNGCFRKLELEENIIEWQNTKIQDNYDIVLPFEIHDLVNLYPKNIIIIAGVPNSGKTAFLLNIIKDNMGLQDIYYFSSEMGAQELKIRLSKFRNISTEQWHFTAIERASNFADCIKPDGLNIIDFLEISDNFYAIGASIKAIYDKLQEGIAIIAIQKKKDADYGRGAEFSMEKARLYITLDSGTLRIVKAKNWKSVDRNPKNEIVDFKLINGCEFQRTNLIISSKRFTDNRLKDG